MFKSVNFFLIILLSNTNVRTGKKLEFILKTIAVQFVRLKCKVWPRSQIIQKACTFAIVHVLCNIQLVWLRVRSAFKNVVFSNDHLAHTSPIKEQMHEYECMRVVGWKKGALLFSFRQFVSLYSLHISLQASSHKKEWDEFFFFSRRSMNRP